MSDDKQSDDESSAQSISSLDDNIYEPQAEFSSDENDSVCEEQPLAVNENEEDSDNEELPEHNLECKCKVCSTPTSEPDTKTSSTKKNRVRSARSKVCTMSSLVKSRKKTTPTMATNLLLRTSTQKGSVMVGLGSTTRRFGPNGWVISHQTKAKRPRPVQDDLGSSKASGLCPTICKPKPRKKRLPVVVHCFECDKKFTSFFSHDRHMNIHYGQNKPYKCYQCGQRFAQDSNLKTHIESQHDKTKYPCPICQKLISSESNMSQHMKKTHGKRKVHCIECDSYMRGDLKRHLASGACQKKQDKKKLA